MIVYVETNFILEIAFRQEEHESCEKILSLSELNRVDLVVPAFSIAEPYDTWTRRYRRRMELRSLFENELREFSRSSQYLERVRELQDFTRLLEDSSEEDKIRLDAILTRILDTARIIPFDSSLMRSAIRFQSELSLSPQDSIVYASIISDLTIASPEAKSFLNKNFKDFLIPQIVDELSNHDCRLIASFENGLGFIEARI